MKLAEYIDGMRAARTGTELEAAIHAPFKHSFRGPTWSRISKVRKECGRAICDAHADGAFVPKYENNRISVCGEAYKVGHGQNSTGVRYCWHYAEKFVQEVLVRKGLTQTAAHAIWGQWSDYPHRCLDTLAEWRDGKLQDPVLNKLILWRTRGEPANVDRKYEEKHRAWRPCSCGGRRWDWGSGWNGWCSFITWHCDGCTRVYGEYLSDDRFRKIRSQPQSDRNAA